METLALHQMEKVHGGGCVNCGGAIAMGVMMGSWAGGGIGATVGATLVALGPNCLDIGGTNKC